MLLFNILGEDKNIWRNNLEVLIGTYLDIFGNESNKEIKVVFLKEPVKYQELEPILLY